MRSALVLAAVPTLMVASLVLAGLVLPASPPSDQSIAFGRTSITIYQVNVAHIAVNLSTTFAGGQARVELPATLIPYSLRVTDPAVTSWRLVSQQPLVSLLQEGDIITVRTSALSYTGSYAGTSGGYLLLEVDGKSVLVKVDTITSIEMKRLVSMPENGARTTIVLEGNLTGTREMLFTFLVRGTGWFAGSELDLRTNVVTAKAFIWSSENWTDALVRLVVGEPRVIFEGTTYRSDFTNEVFPAGVPASVGVEVVGPYYTFTLPGSVNLSSGEQLATRLVSGEVSALQFHLWESSDPRYQSGTERSAELSVNLTNVLDVPIPWGFMSFYEGSDWLGSTSNSYIPIGATHALSIGPSRDVSVLSEIVSSERLSDAMRYSVRLTVRNFGREAALVMLRQGLPTKATVTSVSDQPAQTGTTLTWTLTIGPQDVKTVTFCFEVPLGW